MVHMSKRLAWLEFGLGVGDQLPLQLGVVPFGVVFGVLGTSAGLSPFETILMSSLVFGGASQIVFVQLWAAGAPPPLAFGGGAATDDAAADGEAGHCVYVVVADYEVS